MKTLEVPAANKQLRNLLQQARAETLVLTRKGKPVAALVPIEDVDEESLSLSTNAKFLGILRKSLRELDRGQSLTLAEMRKRVGVNGKSSRTAD